MGATGRNRHPHRLGVDSHFHLSRSHHAAHATVTAAPPTQRQSLSSGGCQNGATSGQTKPEQENPLARSQWSFKTATEMLAALSAKKVSAVELAQDAIDRIERHDGKINALCVRDFDRGLAAARAADAARARGEATPLLGL